MKKRALLRYLAASIAAIGSTLSPAMAAPATGTVQSGSSAPAAANLAPPQGAASTQSSQGGTASSAPATVAASAGNEPIDTIPAASQSTSPPGAQTRLSERPNIESHPASNDLNRVVLVHGDNIHMDDNDVLTIEGHVKVTYRSYILECNKIVVDTDKSVATLTGDVTVTNSTSSLIVRTTDATTAVVIDLKHGLYNVHGAVAAIVPPEYITESGVLVPIYLNGGDIGGKTDFIDARDTGVTTCDYINPHYELVSTKVTVRAGKRLVARHVTVYRHGHRLFTLPLIVLPLNDRYQQQQYVPQTGYSPDEGYFAKFAIPYALSAAAVGLVHIDLMSAKGIGYGVDQAFGTGGGNGPGLNGGNSNAQGGVIKLYTLKDRSLGLQTFTGSLTDFQKLPFKINMHFDSQFANNSYFLSSSQSESLNSNLALTRTVGNSTTSLTTTLQQSAFGEAPTTNLNSSLEQKLSLAHGASADLRVGYTGSDTGAFQGIGGTDQTSLTTDFDFKGPTNHELQYEVLTDTYTSLTNVVAGQASTVTLGSVERYPEIKLTASPIGGQQNPLLHWFPYMNFLTVSLGDFHDPSANVRTQRILINLNTGEQSHKTKRIVTSYSGQFEQDFYGDNSARYILNGTLGSVYDIGDKSNFTINYGSLRPYGYTPFFFDRTGAYNNASMNLTYEPTRKIQIVLASGYDFTQTHSIDGLPATPWQSLSIQLVAKPSDALVNKLVGTYDPNTGMLFDLSDQCNIGMPWGFVYQTGIMYSPSEHTFSTITETLTVPVLTDKIEKAGYTLQALGGYNGYTKMWTYDGLELTRSWHDFQLSAVMENDLTGTPGNTFYLNFTLKGFPGYQPFGVGQFGQGLDTSIGNVL